MRHVRAAHPSGSRTARVRGGHHASGPGVWKGHPALRKKNWLDELLVSLESAGIPREQADEAIAYYYRAIDERIRSGASESEAVGSMDDIPLIVHELRRQVPLAQRVVRSVRKTPTRTTVTVVALILTAVVWVPLAILLALFTLGAYLCIWAMIGFVWAFEAALLAAGVLGVPYLAHAAGAGALVGGVYDAGLLLAATGVGLCCVPAAVWCSRQLFQLTVTLERWVRRLFVNVPDPDRPDVFGGAATAGGVGAAGGATGARRPRATSGAGPSEGGEEVDLKQVNLAKLASRGYIIDRSASSLPAYRLPHVPRRGGQDDGGAPHGATRGGRRSRRWGALGTVGLALAGVGILAALVAMGTCGFDVGRIPQVPPMDLPFDLGQLELQRTGLLVRPVQA